MFVLSFGNCQLVNPWDHDRMIEPKQAKASKSRELFRIGPWNAPSLAKVDRIGSVKFIRDIGLSSVDKSTHLFLKYKSIIISLHYCAQFYIKGWTPIKNGDNNWTCLFVFLFVKYFCLKK